MRDGLELAKGTLCVLKNIPRSVEDSLPSVLITLGRPTRKQ